MAVRRSPRAAAPPELRGRTLAVFVGRQAHTLETTPEAEVTVALEGVVGDKHAGFTRRADARVRHYPRGTFIRNERQVTVVAEEELAQVAEQLGLPEVRAEWLGANVLVAGLPSVTLLPAGAELTFSSGAVLVVQAENLPCTGPGKVIQSYFPGRAGLAARFPKAALHRRGIVACVELAGRIRAGDTVTARLPLQPPYPGPSSASRSE